ncbi:hypothetical protein [Gordonia iterans]
MTDVNGDLIDVAGFRDDGRVRVRSTVARPAQDSAALVTGAWHDFDVVAGLVEMTNLDPGPAEVWAHMGGWRESWTVMIPDEADPISFTTLLAAYVEYPVEVVGQAQSARDAAIAARDVAAGHASAAATSAGDAAAAYAALTDDIENAADAIRAEVESDADTAVTAAGTAVSAANTAVEAAGDAGDSRDAAALSAGSATAAKSAAESARDAAVTARGLAQSAESGAVTARGGAESAQSAAESARDAAVVAKNAAESAKGDAEFAQTGAESARTDALAAETAASNYASAASVSAGAAETARGLAVTAKDDAVTAKNQAQAAASSFGLSAGTVTTGSPSSSAQVTVTGGGPAYTLNFTIPRGQQGIQGPQGTGLQLQDRVANYAALPGGLNSTTDKGKAYIVDSDGLLYIWDGAAFPSSGNGLSIVGAKGDNGKTAYQVAVDEGFVGTAGEWLASLIGDPGKSAYEVAVDNGFVGSESAWLDSLHGEDGADGATSWNDLDDKPSTFPPITGTGSADAKPGDWMPTWSQVSGKPATFPPTIGSGGSQAVAGNDPRLTDARAPLAHSADLVTSGTLHVDRVPSLPASKITSGAFDAARIPTVEKTKLAGGVQTSLDKADSAVQPGAAGSVVVGSLPGSGVSGVLYVVP